MRNQTVIGGVFKRASEEKYPKVYETGFMENPQDRVVFVSTRICLR
jgi:hypothetical protein